MTMVGMTGVMATVAAMGVMVGTGTATAAGIVEAVATRYRR
jgi:hypothetical protein